VDGVGEGGAAVGQAVHDHAGLPRPRDAGRDAGREQVGAVGVHLDDDVAAERRRGPGADVVAAGVCLVDGDGDVLQGKLRQLVGDLVLDLGGGRRGVDVAGGGDDGGPGADPGGVLHHLLHHDDAAELEDGDMKAVQMAATKAVSTTPPPGRRGRCVGDRVMARAPLAQPTGGVGELG
jgi:hypothetical protein